MHAEERLAYLLTAAVAELLRRPRTRGHAPVSLAASQVAAASSRRFALTLNWTEPPAPHFSLPLLCRQ
jgi:hypothetical protein